MPGSKDSIAGRGVTKGPGRREGSELVISLVENVGFALT